MFAIQVRTVPMISLQKTTNFPYGRQRRNILGKLKSLRETPIEAKQNPERGKTIHLKYAQIRYTTKIIGF